MHVRQLILLGMALLPLATAAQVHRCTMAGGAVVYSDSACPSAAEKAGTVQGTARSPAMEAERRRLHALESEDIRMERERIALQRDRVLLERERTSLRREQLHAERAAQLPAGYGATIPASSFELARQGGPQPRPHARGCRRTGPILFCE